MPVHFVLTEVALKRGKCAGVIHCVVTDDGQRIHHVFRTLVRPFRPKANSLCGQTSPIEEFARVVLSGGRDIGVTDNIAARNCICLLYTSPSPRD